MNQPKPANVQGYRQRSNPSLVQQTRRRWTSTPAPSRALCAVSAVVAILASPPSAATGLVPHTATYALTRHASSQSTDTSDVQGSVVVRFEALCGGWQYEQVMAFRLYGEEGQQLEHVTYLSGIESDGGASLTFATHSYEDRELAETVAGEAKLGTAIEPGTAVFNAPDQPTKTLPRNTLFPVAHIQQLLSAMRSGERHMSQVVFDGSTPESPFEISTFIGRPKAAADPTGSDAIESQRVWPLSIAYFPVEAIDPAPDFEMQVDLFENGVAGDMVYDYGDLAMAVELREVEMLKRPSCP